VKSSAARQIFSDIGKNREASNSGFCQEYGKSARAILNQKHAEFAI
jgi:hypothetical protein